MATATWTDLDKRLSAALELTSPPVAITFASEPPAGVAAFDEPMAPPLPDGRTGRVPAGCVFWVKGADRTFSTVAEDHSNCSVGSVTHGFRTLEEVAGNADVAALVGSGWVSVDEVAAAPVVRERPGVVVYGPLAGTPVDPDVVLLRLAPAQLMVLSDALPGLRVEAKPQCQIVAIAKEEGTAAASIGCAASRARTGMSPGEMTCAIPAGTLAQVVASVEEAAHTDGVVAAYAAEDAARFA
jgi:uncharacterized protein (DUF169 family)